MNRILERAVGLAFLAAFLPACGIGGVGTLNPAVAPPQPADVKALAGYHGILLTWTSPSTDAVFTVKRSLTSGGPYFPISTPGNFPTPNSYSDRGLVNGSQYYYVVSASNPFGQSQDSPEVVGTPGFTALAVATSGSANHSLAILQDRTLWSFGINTSGELGQGIPLGLSGTPGQVLGLSGVSAAAAGYDFSLALLADSSVWSWGKNDTGQLGQGTASTNPIQTPTPLPGFSNIEALSAGGNHALALDHNGNVWAWGDNSVGQIGQGSAGGPAVSSPTLVPGLSGVIAISAGYRHSLVLREDGTVWAWGDNSQGQLGQGSVSTTPQASPVQVANITFVKSISAGPSTSGAVRSDGSLWLWGYNYNNDLGLSATLTQITLPTQMTGLPLAKAVSMGNGYVLALFTNGTVKSWGFNGEAQCGLGSTTPTYVTVPTSISQLQSVAALAAGNDFGLALLADQTVQSWGNAGQTGNSASVLINAPAQVQNFTNVTGVAAGGAHTVALRSDGSVWTWGSDDYGETGNGLDSLTEHPDSSPIPFQVPGLSGMTAVGASTYGSFAVKNDGTLWAWGINQYGTTGQGSVTYDTTSPQKVLNLTGSFVQLTGSVATTFALRGDGTLWGWGVDEGLLGSGSTSQFHTYLPQQVPGLLGITAVGSNGAALALKNDGSLWGWTGLYTAGYVGNGAPTGTAVPSPQQIMTGVASFAPGQSFSLAVTTAGTVYGWGAQYYGQLGNGSSATAVLAPVQIPGLSSAVQVTVGVNHGLMLKSDGTVWAWGQGYYGQLGLGDYVDRGSPVQIPGLSQVVAIAAGDNFSLAIRSDGTLWTWGDNSLQQLGFPTPTAVLVPTTIL